MALCSLFCHTGGLMDYLSLYRDMIALRGLTSHTIRSYTTYVSAYLDYLNSILKKSPEDVGWDDMRLFLSVLQNERKLSDRTINCAISQLRFFTIYVLHRPWDSSQLPFRKFDTYLPYVPSQDDTFRFISSIPDLKPKTMCALMYSSGLRIGEVCRLRYEDIDRRNMRIHICSSKAREDRYAIMSKYALDLLTQYWFQYGRPMGFLFYQKTDKQKPVDTFYLSRHIHAHEERLGWPRRLTCHSFRHAFGTHLYENGTDLLTIKALLGHRSLNSTTIYVHLASNRFSSVVNPLDRMGGFHAG